MSKSSSSFSSSWDLMPLLALGAVLVVFAVFRDELPARIPVHWGVHGPDRFVSPERGLVESIGIAFVIWLPLFLMSRMGTEGDKASLAAKAFLTPLRALVPTALLFFMGCVLASPILGASAFGVGIGIFLVGVLAAIILGFLRLPPGALKVDPEDPSQQAKDCWRWGLFYVNAEDARLWVPKRYGGGWTFNFAHPRAKVYTAMMLALPLLLALATLLFT